MDLLAALYLVFWLLVSALGWGVSMAEAQSTQTCTPNATRINVVNNGADITVGTTAADVLQVSADACQRYIYNRGSAAMRCLPKPQGTPTPDIGIDIEPGQQILMGTAGREAWWCIAATSTPTIVLTIEEKP